MHHGCILIKITVVMAVLLEDRHKESIYLKLTLCSIFSDCYGNFVVVIGDQNLETPCLV